MSAVQDTTTAQPAEAVVERVMTNPTPLASATGETTVPATTEAAPVAATTEATKPEETVAAPAAVEEETAAAPAAETKVAEPITEGQLGYKAPGLLKQFTFSKKEFWLSDSPVTSQNLASYLRGEKSEVSHPVAAWASQTGKGLLFFNKKGESDRAQPAGVIALYDATDLKKASPHEFTFEISGHKHSFKANNDTERDGWYQSIEKSIELGKASKESVRDSEIYKTEMEKLNTPNTIGGAAAVAKTGDKSVPKKSTEVDAAEPKRVGSSDGEDEELKKKNNTKSRSTSRGMLNRLKGKKEEHDVKKEEKEAVKEEKAAEKELSKTEEATPVVAAAAPVATTETPVVESATTAEPAAAAPIDEKPIEALPVAAETTTTDDKAAKPAKRASIFGRIPSAWGNLKSPSKEKAEKDAELKPEVPAKDAAVTETAPQLPETATTEPIQTPVVADATKPEITETAPEATKTTDAVTPGKEKKNFLSGLSFMNKRDRSVSPSAAVKEQPVKTDAAPVVPAKDEVVAAEPVKAEEPVTEATPAAVPAATEPVEKVEEPKTDAVSPNGNKRQSMLGNLGRRASKAINRFQPKKENAAPAAEKQTVADEATTPVATEKKAEETTPVVSDAEAIAARATGTPVVPAVKTEEENKPETVGVTPSAQVAASA